jgi:uncharacterized protein (TIGR03435 family)
MLWALLADRFQVKVHREMRESPVYVLVTAKRGPKLKESDREAMSRLTLAGGRTIRITTIKGSVEQLAGHLSGDLGRPVVDRTGLTGSYDHKLEWASDGGVAGDSNGPSIFSVVQEQLGLRLESTKAPIETVVIDRVEKPTEN